MYVKFAHVRFSKSSSYVQVVLNSGECIVKTVEELVKKAVSRRSFLAGAGTAAAATVIVGCSSGTSTTTTPVTTTPVTTTPTAPTYVDADYLNFALNLEYLEAQFYLNAATGSGLTAADMGSGAGATTGGGTAIPSSTITAVQQQYLYEVAQNELDHVRLLRSALGSAAVACPAINIGTSFSALAIASGIIASGATFNPFTSYADFLLGAFIFEDVGVTAYLGAAGKLTTPSNLTAAAEIMAVEAYHAASIRTQIVLADSTASGATASSNPYLAYANDISALRATLGGGGEVALSATSIVPCDATNAIAFARTTDEVLHIVYGTANGAGVSSGGFFPNGLNGNIKVTFS